MRDEWVTHISDWPTSALAKFWIGIAWDQIKFKSIFWTVGSKYAIAIKYFNLL